MNIQKDFQEFLKLLNEKRVEYVVVGGYAVAFHGYVRVTKDLDILFHNTSGNIKKIISALDAFGFSAESLNAEAFSVYGGIIRLGVQPVQIELINAVSGITFDEIWKNRVKGNFGDTTVTYISKPDLLTNKKASGRPQDIADYEELRSIN